LKKLDKSYLYDFKFSLFLYTNDSNKKLLYLSVESAFDNSLFSDTGASTEEKMIWLTLSRNLFKAFEFRGYFAYINDSYIDLNSIKDFTKYANVKMHVLADRINAVNPKYPAEGFIEFHKPVLLSITRYKAGCSESIDNCNKCEGGWLCRCYNSKDSLYVN
jgi:hypothetical protein